MPNGTPITSAGSTVANRIVRCCARASLKTSWRLAYSLSRERSLNVPENKSTSGKMKICACNSQRHDACSVMRRMASLAASSISPSPNQNPLPRLVLARGLPVWARYVAVVPAVTSAAITNNWLITSVNILPGFPGTKHRRNSSKQATANPHAMSGRISQS